MGSDDGLPTISFASSTAWELWLADNHAAAEGVWIRIAKKDVDVASVRYPEVLESALCFGWIDGRRQALDGRHFLQRFTPRRPRSRWSQINREKAEQLIAQDRMRPAGLAEVDRAKADGRWAAAYAGQKSSAVPEDLQRELDARPNAKAFFAALDSQNRYAIIYRLHDAKKPETRARRLAKFVTMLQAGEAIYPESPR
ncbi:MAG: YdeI family protein [Gemmatimonadales bacterium]